MMIKSVAATLLLSCLSLTSSFAAITPLPVVTSFSILGDITKAIGGDAVTIQTLVGPNGDCHEYQPTPNDAKAIVNAQLVIVNGLGLEGWIDRVIKASGYQGPVIVASNAVTPYDHDPHAWQDVGNARHYAATIATALSAAMPAQAPAIKARADAYDHEMAQLDQQVRTAITAVPAPQRRVITTHDAFGYFGRAYGVEFMAPEGLSTETEPSPATIVKLNKQIQQQGIKTVFLENMSDSRLIKQIARDTDATVGGTLYADALSPPSGPAATYLTMMRHNVALLVGAMRQNRP